MSSMHAFARDSSSESSGEEDDFLHPSTDPNADEFADYNPRKRRRTGRNAKESAALGVFGSESEEDDGPGRKWKRKSNLRGKGMAFVSTGQKTFDDDDDDEEDEEEEGEEDMEMEDVEEDEEAEAPKGLGFGSAPRGLGFQSPAPGKKINNAPKTSTPLGRGFVPSSAAVPILKNNDDDEVSTPRIARPSAFSTPASNGRSAKKAQAGPSVNAGSFAARMMAKMGYKEGEGLGKDGTGRSGVIEVTLRPQGVGLGAVKEKSKQEIEEEKRQAQIRGEKYEDSDEERKKRRKKPRASGIESGSGSGMSTPRRAQKPKFRTLEEVQRAAPGLQIPDAFAPILDMTAPGQRLLTSTSGLLTPTTVTESVEQIESKKLARRAQNDLSAYVEEWKNLEERKAYIEMTIIQHQQELDEEQREFDRMKSFAASVHSISQSVRDLQWDPVLQALLVANPLSESGNSTVNEELSNIAVAAVHPFLRQATEGWQPLEDPKLTGMVPQLSKIRHILGATSSESKSVAGQDYLVNDGSHRIHAKSTTAYESMIYKIIFPKIVSAVNQNWDVYDPTPLLSIFEAWEGLLPSFVRSQILNQAVVGKLNEAVSSWNPKKRRTHELPHLWLFPWLQYLPAHHADPESSTGLVSDVKRKFRQLIDTWDFHKGVVPGLRQWREVLSTSSKNNPWMSLVMNHVIPSMARFLQNEKNFVVDPNDQAPYMSALQGIFAWKDILSPKVVGEVIGRTVFPGWHDVLHQWLTVVGPNEEIGQWFEWWRDEVFPDEIKNLPSIQKEFDKGHEMINQALDLGSLAATQLPAPSTRQHVSPPPAKNTPAKPAPAPVVEESTFRHKVEDWCIENDLQLLPEKKVLHSAGPLYRITAAGNGKNGTLAYFKGDSLWVLTRKGAENAEIRIDWESPDARDALFGMAWQNVK
jgi:tuftelin-interacting protein 11